MRATVVTEDGTPIEGATVVVGEHLSIPHGARVDDISGAHATKTTGAGGYVEFPGDASGQAVASHPEEGLGVADLAASHVIQLRRTRRLRGLVVQQDKTAGGRFSAKLLTEETAPCFLPTMAGPHLWHSAMPGGVASITVRSEMPSLRGVCLVAPEARSSVDVRTDDEEHRVPYPSGRTLEVVVEEPAAWISGLALAAIGAPADGLLWYRFSGMTCRWRAEFCRPLPSRVFFLNLPDGDYEILRKTGAGWRPCDVKASIGEAADLRTVRLRRTASVL